jgi:hypothetical protein
MSLMGKGLGTEAWLYSEPGLCVPVTRAVCERTQVCHVSREE